MTEVCGALRTIQCKAAVSIALVSVCLASHLEITVPVVHADKSKN